MNDIARTVLESYQVRKTKKQKTAFIDYVADFACGQGYACSVERGMLGARNIVIGEPEQARVIYTAHYDTCPRLPFPNFITPKNLFVYLLYQVVITLALFAVLFTAEFLVGVGIGLILVLTGTPETVGYAISAPVFLAITVLFLWLLLAGPANRHTANDNTSGVVTLLSIMQALPQEQRERVAFIFFDLEEVGLFGSASYAGKHKKEVDGTLLLNFDCVSDGDRILLAVNKKASAHIPLLQRTFAGNSRYTVDVRAKGVFYPSDQANFKNGVGVAALNYSPRFRVEYVDKIHTDKDRVFEAENIAFLTECAIRLAEEIQ